MDSLAEKLDLMSLFEINRILLENSGKRAEQALSSSSYQRGWNQMDSINNGTDLTVSEIIHIG